MVKNNLTIAVVALFMISAVLGLPSHAEEAAKTAAQAVSSAQASGTAVPAAPAAQPANMKEEALAAGTQDDPAKMTKEDIASRIKEILHYRPNLMTGIEGMEVKKDEKGAETYFYKGKSIDAMSKDELLVLLKAVYQQVSLDNMKRFELQQRQMRNLKQIEQMNKQQRMLKQMQTQAAPKPYTAPKVYTPPKTYKAPSK